MSTKSTLKIQWYDLSHEGFHLFEECFDGGPGPVYLELNGCDFTASSKGEGGLPYIEIAIPRSLAIAMGLLPKPKAAQGRQ
jgi:hypothetical protein